MDGLSACFSTSNSDVICEATLRWCSQTREPDQHIMSRAIELFNRGHNTPERLLEALQKDLLN
jgi:hypothetical protein